MTVAELSVEIVVVLNQTRARSRVSDVHVLLARRVVPDSKIDGHAHCLLNLFTSNERNDSSVYAAKL